MKFFKSCLACLMLCLLMGTSVAPAVSQDAGRKKPAPKPIAEEELEIAGKIFNMLDGEQQMLLNGLRFLMRPQYERELMRGRFYTPAPLTVWGTESKRPYTMLESLRLWAVIAGHIPYDADMEVEINRFLATEHKRYEDSLAAYAVPMAVCNAALRRPELKHEKELKDKAEDLMYVAMKVRDLTAVDSPCIVRGYIWPMWYGNHVWRAVMARCCIEIGIKYNEHIWDSELKNVSQATQKELGWISTHGSNLDAENDLNCNLMAMAAISLGMTSPKKDGLPKSARNSLEKRIEFVPQILKRLEDEYSGAALTGARLALVRTFDPSYAPTEREPAHWRQLVRQTAVNGLLASGAVFTDTDITHELGLDGRMRHRRARIPAETALNCLSVCGGFYGETESPLAAMKPDDIRKAMKALSLLHASVLPPMPPGGELALEVEMAIEDGCEWLIKRQLSDGTFGEKIVETVHPAYVAASIHALMHGNYEPDSAPVKAGIEWLREHVPTAVDNRGKGGRVTMYSYDAGIVLMMYGRYYESLLIKEGVLESVGMGDANTKRAEVWKQVHKRDQYVISKLVEYLDAAYIKGSKGGWGYYPPDRGQKQFHSDNSISQFAGCGYKCAALLGAKTDIDVFRNEADRLLAQYAPPKGQKDIEFELYEQNTETADERHTKGGIYERREWEGQIFPGGWSYTTTKAKGIRTQYVGTGMALLAAARDELWAHNKLTLEMHRKIDLHIFGAQAWLGQQDFWQYDYEEDSAFEEAEHGGQNKPGGHGWGGIYNLYALERGCVMTGYDMLLGKIDWYYHAASWLLDNQAEDGSWGDELNTAWAILILRRAAPPSITVPNPPPSEPGKKPGPLTERERNPRSPITPGRVKPEKKDEPETKPVGPITPDKEEK